MSKLYNKYTITKNNGVSVDPEAEYFVLRLDSDPIALYALKKYAEAAKIEDPDLSKDLLKRIHYYNEKIKKDMESALESAPLKLLIRLMFLSWFRKKKHTFLMLKLSRGMTLKGAFRQLKERGI